MNLLKNKKIFNKKHLIFFVLLILASTVICFSLSKKQNENSNNPQGYETGKEATQNQDENFPLTNKSLEETGLDSLEIGQKILASGEGDDNGNISAKQIIISNSEDYFRNMDFSEDSSLMPGPENNQAENSQVVPQNGNFTPGERPDFGQIQNMTEEEQLELMKKMKTERGTAERETRKSSIKLIGEIIGKDDSIITLQLEDGGSKFIFYSTETRVFESSE